MAADYPMERVASCSIGSTLVVANKNTSALNVPVAGQAPDGWFASAGDISDSQSLFSSASTSDSGLLDEYAHTVPNNDNIRPIKCVGWNYLNLYHVWRGNNTVTQAPRVVVLGKIPRVYPVGENIKAWPNDDDPDFPDLGEFWIPLTQTGETTQYIEFPTTAGARFTSKMYVSAPSKYVYLQGVQEIMVFVTQTATFSNTQLVSMSSSAATITEFSSSSSAGSDTSYGMIAAQFSG